MAFGVVFLVVVGRSEVRLVTLERDAVTLGVAVWHVVVLRQHNVARLWLLGFGHADSFVASLPVTVARVR
jgi:hypothetical protein